MPSDMLILVPSRGRPENAARLLTAWAQTHAEADLLFCVDSDDETLPGYWDVTEEIAIAERKRIGPTLNDQALRHTSQYRVIGFMGDDHLPRTEHWDHLMSQTIP